jgi:hypothetical protein
VIGSGAQQFRLGVVEVALRHRLLGHQRGQALHQSLGVGKPSGGTRRGGLVNRPVDFIEHLAATHFRSLTERPGSDDAGHGAADLHPTERLHRTDKLMDLGNGRGHRGLDTYFRRGRRLLGWRLSAASCHRKQRCQQYSRTLDRQE